jgi:hypothetical protein
MFENAVVAEEARPVAEFEGVPDVWPRGDRLQAVRDAAARFRERFRAAGTVRAVRTVELAAAAYPARFAFHGAARAVNPYVNIVNRMLIVQFENFGGELKTLVWEPTVPQGSREAPFYDQLIKRYGSFLSDNVFARYYAEVPDGLRRHGLSADDVDYAAFDHLHVQDPRMLMGTTGAEGATGPWPPILANARFICQRREVDTFRSPHPMQWAWYVERGMDSVREEALALVDGDVELGPGIALLATPGHTDGNQSLCLNTPDGIWVSSENGVAADNWQPELSRIPGVRREAEFFRREVIMNANTLEDSVDQYDSMVKEKLISDRNRRDPRWKNILPSSELAPWRRQWPVVPTFLHGPDALTYGAIAPPARAA